MEDVKIEAPYDLQVEHYHGNPLAIRTNKPRLSWKYPDHITDSEQVELEISHHMPGQSKTVETVKTEPVNNVLLPWPLDQPLNSREQVKVRVRLTGDEGNSDWSEPLKFEVGILEYWDLLGKFVGPTWFEGRSDHRHLPLVRTEFSLKDQPVYARLYLSALGLVEGNVNGQKIGKDILTPGWTCYDDRLECWTYDLTSTLTAGKNALGFYLGDGWYRGRLGFKGGKVNVYGDKIGVYAQLEIVYADGTTDEIVSNSDDNQWKAVKGPITQSDMCEGESYDAHLEQLGWDKPGFDDSNWSPVAEIPYDKRKMEFPILPPVRANLENKPVSIKKISEKNGKTNWQIDFGQNCTQRIKLHITNAKDGDVIELQHAEVLEKDGRLSTRPLRRGQQIDRYTSNGKQAYFEAKFATHGFRYAEIRGWRGELTADDLQDRVYFSDMEQTGWFESSNQRVNRLNDNALWSMRSNFVSLPTDCPQQDERLGWTGDISLFSPTAAYFYDVEGFLSSWLQDVAHEQKRLGTVPFYVPFIPFAEWTEPQAIAIWGDSAVRVPWFIYMASGDKQLLAKQFPAARAWIDEVKGYLSDDGVWDRRPPYLLGQLGDWLDPSAPADDPVKAMTAKNLVATAFYAKSCDLFVQIAHELHDEDTENKYAKLARHVRIGFQHRFFNDKGIMTSDTQCAYALAITFGLVDDDPELKEFAGHRLALLVRRSHGKVSTGFAGTPYILPALTETGHMQEAYSLFLSDKNPSWMYQVKMGGTTTWERWDSMLPDKSVNPGVMTSFNHYSLGSVADWMHATIGGLTPLTPGWHQFRVAPRPGGKLTSAKAAHTTPYGKAAVQWSLENGELSIRVTVPYGTSAQLDIPGYDTIILTDGVHNETFNYQS